MKRFSTLALLLGSFAACGLTGCSEETKDKTVSTSSGPDGSKKVVTEQTTTTTGDQKPSEPKP